MRRRNVNFNLDDLDVPMLRDELMAAKFDEDTEPVSVGEGVVSPVAKREAAMLQDRSDWGNIGATLGQALGHNVPTKYWDSLAQRGQQTLADAKSDAKTAELRKQFQDRIKAQADLQKQKIAAEQAAAEQKRGYELDDASAQRSFEMEKLGSTRGFESQKMKDQQAFDREQRGLDRSAANERNRVTAAALSGRNTAATTAKADEAKEKKVELLGKDLEDTAAQASDLTILTNAAQQKDIPGVGSVDNWTPSFMMSDAGIQTEQAVLRTIQRISKAQSGTAISEKEAERIAKARGILGGTEKQFRIGMQSLLQEAQDVTRSKEAKYPADIRQTYEERGGKTSSALPPVDTQLAPGAETVRPVGKRVRNGVVEYKMSDGSIRVGSP